jgi:2-polyprenyl-6-methoxyphenol hydroxylase-like FAD-dependent oxidoreductase
VSVSSLDTGFSEIVVVGGGIGGATIALVLARAGLTVTVLEQQPSYRDRVRGEYMQPWGVAEAQHLGIGERDPWLGRRFFRTPNHSLRRNQRPACSRGCGARAR